MLPEVCANSSNWKLSSSPIAIECLLPASEANSDSSSSDSIFGTRLSRWETTSMLFSPFLVAICSIFETRSLLECNLESSVTVTMGIKAPFGINSDLGLGFGERDRNLTGDSCSRICFRQGLAYLSAFLATEFIP